MRPIDQKGAEAFPPPQGLLERFREQHSEVCETQAQILFWDLKRFLVVTVNIQDRTNGKRYSPPADMDLMWHHFILDDLEVYIKYCETHLGGIVYHRNTGVVPWDEEFKKYAGELQIFFKTPWQIYFGGCG